MILYHGSTVEVSRPDLLHSRQNVDFGKGFYTTPLYEQALKWCKRFKKIDKNAVINYYQINEDSFKNYKVLNFESYSENWLDFILNCRKGIDNTSFDVVMGGVANDKVFNTVELFFENLISKEEAIKRLKYEEPNLQICFKSQILIDQELVFLKSENIC